MNNYELRMLRKIISVVYLIMDLRLWIKDFENRVYTLVYSQLFDIHNL